MRNASPVPPTVLYHYTKAPCLVSIFRHFTLWPSPPLRAYGINRQEVEASPARFGFRVGRLQGRRFFFNEKLHHPGDAGWGSAVSWIEGQVFDVALTRANWCHSVMAYFPEEEQVGGFIFRLVLNTEGLDLYGWQDYQQRANVPAAYRRQLGESTFKKNDDPHDWWFFFGELPLDGRLVEVEQYHQGRWTSSTEVCERAPLRERPWHRCVFQATFARSGRAPGLLGASLFQGVTLDGLLVADHVWVQQTWPHLSPGERCRFFATVVPYRRRDATVGWTLGEVNGLEVL